MDDTGIDPERAFLAEYRSLRDESAQARQAQQTILQWSLGAFGLFFGLLLSAPLPLNFFVLLFGLGIPFLALAAGLAWFGELMRMERAGFYLRAREKLVWPPSHSDETGPEWTNAISKYPLAWENFIASGSDSSPSLRVTLRDLFHPEPRKQVVGYFGALLIYLGAIALSEALLTLRIWSEPFSGSDWVWKILAIVWSLAVTVVSTFWFGSLTRALLRWGRQTAADEFLDDQTLST